MPRLEAVLAEPVLDGALTKAKPMTDVPRRQALLDEPRKRLGRDSSFGCLPLSVNGREPVLSDPVSDGRSFLTRDRPDLFEGKAPR